MQKPTTKTHLTERKFVNLQLKKAAACGFCLQSYRQLV